MNCDTSDTIKVDDYMTYRDDARVSVKRATEELSANDDSRLRYAALEIRLALEALTYDRAMAYKDELPPNEYATWQPRKLMAVLLDLDENADQHGKLFVGLEEVPGKPAEKMDFMGEERVLNLAAIKKNYDAIGAYLHALTLKQSLSGEGVDFDSLRKRCSRLVKLITEVLESPIFNIVMGAFSTLECMACGKPVRKRIPSGSSSLIATCFECQATYDLVDAGNGDVQWHLHQEEIPCANKICNKTVLLLRKDIQLGNGWICKGCSGRNDFVIGIKHDGSNTP